MALVVKDRVQETTTTVGTGTVTLGGAVLGFQTFAIIGDGNTTYYAIVDPTTGEWEVGVGTYTASGTTLSRTVVFESSNSGSLVSFAAGSKNVFCTYPAERAVYLDAAGSAVTLLDIGTLGASTANITTANITSGTVSTTPTNNTDIVNKAYADAIASGIHFHEAVALATTTTLPANTYNNGTSGVGATLTGNANGALSVDSTLTIVAERILVKNEAAGENNGVYVVTQVGSAGTPYILTRATDFDTAGTGVDQIDEGDFFLVTNGVVNLNTAWVQQTAPPITVGTTAIVFQQFSAPITYTAGTGLSESPTYTFNIANTGTAGTYGSASSVPVFVTNAQGQVTSVTNTGIAISSGAVSGLAASATTDTTNADNITSGTLGTSRLSGSYTGVTGVGTLTAGTWNATAINAVYGGTGITSYSVGDIVYADTTTSLAKLADVAVGNALISGGVAAAPSWGKIGLATHVSGTLPIANGGTNSTATPTNGGVVYGTGTAQAYSTAGTSGQVLTSAGAAAPTWTTATNANTASAIVQRDGSGNFSAGTITAALSGNASTSSTATSANGLSGINSNISSAVQTGTISSMLAQDTNASLYRYTAGAVAAFITGQAINTTGNAATATVLQTARTIGGVSFNGSANINLPGVNAAGNQNTTGSSGSCTGNAATATALSSGQTNWSGTGVLGNVVGLMAWKNYGNSHVIFDASNSTSPSGGAVNSTNAAIAWSATYPTLMGWNGSSTYGVRVDSARISDSTSGNSATVGGYAVSVAAAANTIPTRNSSAYFAPGSWISSDGNYGIYWPNSTGAPHWYPNQSTYGNMQLDGIKNSYAGIRMAGAGNPTIGMFDGSGNGGLYNYSYWIYYWLVGNACLGIRTSSTSSSYAIYVDGGIYSTGNVVAYSDVRKKREIVTVDNALATVNKLRGVFYKRIETNDEKVDPNKRQIGVIAQEVNEVLPEAVTYAKDVDEYGVQYGNMAGLFIEAIKELTAKIEKQDAKIKELEERLAK
jgi:hypothetical protein